MITYQAEYNPLIDKWVLYSIVENDLTRGWPAKNFIRECETFDEATEWANKLKKISK